MDPTLFPYVQVYYPNMGIGLAPVSLASTWALVSHVISITPTHMHPNATKVLSLYVSNFGYASVSSQLSL